jgi:hypothetical protein
VIYHLPDTRRAGCGPSRQRRRVRPRRSLMRKVRHHGRVAAIGTSRCRVDVDVDGVIECATLIAAMAISARSTAGSLVPVRHNHKITEFDTELLSPAADSSIPDKVPLLRAPDRKSLIQLVPVVRPIFRSWWETCYGAMTLPSNRLWGWRSRRLIS